MGPRLAKYIHQCVYNLWHKYDIDQSPGKLMPRHLFGRLLLVITGLVLSITAIAPPCTVEQPGDVRIDVWNEESLSTRCWCAPTALSACPWPAGWIPQADPGRGGREDLQGLGSYMKDTPRVVVSLINVSGNKHFVIGRWCGREYSDYQRDRRDAGPGLAGLSTFAARTM